MPKFLSGDAAEHYHRDGFYFPIRVLSPAEARGYRDRLDAVKDIIGPDILLWSSSFFIKEPRDEGRLKLDELITQRLRLEQVNEGFAGMVKGNVVRAVLLLN